MFIYKSENKESDGYIGKVIIFYSIRISGNRRRDLDNMVQSINDSLVKSGKIIDDSYKQIERQIIGFEKVEKGNEGFDLIIINY